MEMNYRVEVANLLEFVLQVSSNLLDTELGMDSELTNHCVKVIISKEDKALWRCKIYLTGQINLQKASLNENTFSIVINLEDEIVSFILLHDHI